MCHYRNDWSSIDCARTATAGAQPPIGVMSRATRGKCPSDGGASTPTDKKRTPIRGVGGPTDCTQCQPRKIPRSIQEHATPIDGARPTTRGVRRRNDGASATIRKTSTFFVRRRTPTREKCAVCRNEWTTIGEQRRACWRNRAATCEKCPPQGTVTRER